MTGARPKVLNPPASVGGGDRVQLVVIDSVWGNRYVAGLGSDDITAVEPNLVFGGEGLQKLTSKFAPFVGPPSGGAGDGGAPFELDSSCAAGAPGDMAAIELHLAELRTLHGALEALRDSIHTTVHLLSSPTNEPIRAFVMNPDVHRLVHRVAADSLPGQTASRLLALAAERGVRPDHHMVDGLVLQARAYGRRVEGIAALVPPARLSSQAGLGLGRFREQVLRYPALHAAATGVRHQVAGFTACIAGELPDATLSLVQHGVDLTPLVTDPVLDPGALDRSLLRIAGHTELLASTLNTIPGWARGPAEQVVLERAFAGNKEVTIAVFSRPRYGQFQAHVQEAPAGEDAEGGEAEEEEPISPPRLSQARDDTVATIRFEVYPRHRFHLGAGFVRSPLRTRGYRTAEDTVNGVPGLRISQTGDTPFQVFPVGLLSYSVLPAAGQIYDARVQPGWPSLQRMGLAVQAGVSLTDPTEDLMFGVSTEPFPGLHLGAGYHLSYVEVARAAPGTFVPTADGPAVESRWRGEWGAVSLAVDAAVFFSTIGALLK